VAARLAWSFQTGEVSKRTSSFLGTIRLGVASLCAVTFRDFLCVGPLDNETRMLSFARGLVKWLRNGVLPKLRLYVDGDRAWLSTRRNVQ